MTNVAITTLKNEADAINNLIENFQTEEFEKAISLILRTEGKLVFTGLGKTGHIGKKLAATFASTGTPAFFLHSTESNHGDLGMVDFGKDTLVAISHSGESYESFNTIRICNEYRMRIITLCNNDNSTIAKLGTVNLKNFVKKEACPLGLAPTSSTTVTLALGDALATETMSRKGFTPEDFGLSHPAGKLGRRLLKASSSELMKPLPSINENSTFMEALAPLNKYRLGCLAVINSSNQLTGFLSSGDFTRGLEKVGLDGNISDAMSQNPKIIDHDELGIGGFNRMVEENVSSLIVIKNNMPIGLLDIKVCEHMFN